MFFAYVLAFIGLIGLIGFAAITVSNRFGEPESPELEPYQTAIDAAGRLQAEAWQAIQRLHELRVNSSSADIVDSTAVDEKE